MMQDTLGNQKEQQTVTDLLHMLGHCPSYWISRGGLDFDALTLHLYHPYIGNKPHVGID